MLEPIVDSAKVEPLVAADGIDMSIKEHFDSVTDSMKDPRFHDDFRDYLLNYDLDAASLQPPEDTCSTSLAPAPVTPKASGPSSPPVASSTTSLSQRRDELMMKSSEG
eukprot:7391008-Lingulodinium_polyedra.AAC.1